MRVGLLLAAAFLLVSVALSGVLPLWLDEILQLIETRDTSAAEMIRLLPRHPGAAPLGYLAQHAAFAIAGYSERLARFPSSVFVAGTVLLTALLGAEFGVKRVWPAPALFAMFPLALRYACESRTYAPGLFFSALATLLFVRMGRSGGSRIAYCGAVLCAIYSQPYAVSVAVGHLLWAWLEGDKARARWAAAAIGISVAAFAPWYWWTKAIWAQNIEGAGVRFSISIKTPLMLFREMAGAGYWGSGLLTVAMAMAARKKGASLLVWAIVAPVALALGGDAVFGYFVATRQILWVLPAVAVLAALGMERLGKNGVAIAALLAVVCAWQSVRYFTGPHENWKIAADLLAADVNDGACLVVVPAEELRSYAYFRPELKGARCPAPTTIVAVTPYATARQREAAAAAVRAEGARMESSREAGMSRIEMYAR